MHSFNGKQRRTGVERDSKSNAAYNVSDQQRHPHLYIAAEIGHRGIHQLEHVGI